MILIIKVNGNVDPWHALGFTSKAPNRYTDTVFIPGINQNRIHLRI